MRTTVTLSEDVARAVEQLRRERGIGVSDAVNELARAGLARRARRRPFVQRTHAMGARVDVTNVGDVLDLLDQADGR